VAGGAACGGGPGARRARHGRPAGCAWRRGSACWPHAARRGPTRARRTCAGGGRRSAPTRWGRARTRCARAGPRGGRSGNGARRGWPRRRAIATSGGRGGATVLATRGVRCALCQGAPAGAGRPPRPVVFVAAGARGRRDVYQATRAARSHADPGRGPPPPPLLPGRHTGLPPLRHAHARALPGCPGPPALAGRRGRGQRGRRGVPGRGQSAARPAASGPPGRVDHLPGGPAHLHSLVAGAPSAVSVQRQRPGRKGQ